MIPVRLMEDLVNADILQMQLDHEKRVKFIWLIIGGVCGFLWGVILI